jgi:WD40 repeat protein
MPMNRYALLIACNQGRGLPTLRGAEKDLQRVRDLLLRHPSGWGHGERIFALSGNVAPRQIDEAAQTLKQKITPDDFLLVYYAGHGRSHDGEAYLALPRHDYPVRQLTNTFLTQSPTRGVLMALDCCYSEPASISAFHRFIESLFPREAREARAAHHGQRAVFAAAIASAWEDDRGGIMTSAYIDGCDGGKPDLAATNDGIVDVDSLKRYIERSLLEQPQGQTFTGVTLGVFDIRTELGWRLKKHGNRIYQPQNFIVFPEQTRLWYPSARSRKKLLSAHSIHHSEITAAGYENEDVVLLKLDRSQHTFREVRRFAVKSTERGIKLDSGGQVLAVQLWPSGGAHANKIEVFAADSGQELRTYDVVANQHVVLTGALLVTSNAENGLIEVWPLSRKDAVAEGSIHVPYPVNHLRALADGKRLISGGQDGKVVLWDLGDVSERVHKRRELDGIHLRGDPLSPFEESLGQVMRVAASADDSLVAAGFGGRGRVRTWRLDNPSQPLPFGRLEDDHGSYITALEFSDDVKWLASGCGGGNVFLLSLKDRVKPVPAFATPDQQRQEAITALAFIPQSHDAALVIGTSTGRVCLYQIATGSSRELPDPYQRGEVYRIGIVADSDEPVTLLLAAQAGLEGWDFSWDS